MLVTSMSVGHATTRASTPSNASPARRRIPATCSCPECSTRACCAARTRTRASAASMRRRRCALPGVKAVLTHENCDVRVGRRLDLRRRAIQRRDQEDHQTPPLRVQQSGALRRRTGRGGRRGRSAHRRRSAATDRGRLRTAAVRARSGRGAEARRRPDLAGRQPVAERAQRGGADRRGAATSRKASRPPTTFSRIATRPRSCTTPRWNRASASPHGRATS